MGNTISLTSPGRFASDLRNVVWDNTSIINPTANVFSHAAFWESLCPILDQHI